ncbi:MAG TPA: GNAT family N-acetyltransferase [Armatimonadota bacterium]|nr:GNAT family N-acetyltransferase [Armatimonadota bacterium]
MRCRLFLPRDRARCLAVFDSNCPPFFSPGERSQFAAFLARVPGRYLVVEEAREVVACGGLAPSRAPGEARMCWGMVRRDRHLRGIGRILLLARLALACRDAAFTSISLDTSQHTFRFYERFGFFTLSVAPDGYGPGMDRYEMRLDLDEERRATLLRAAGEEEALRPLLDP